MRYCRCYNQSLNYDEACKMVKRNKILKKILSGSKNIRFAEFVALLEAFGLTFERISGSHHIFSHPHIPQAISIQPDQNGQAKPYQLKQFMKLIEKYDLRMTTDEPSDEPGDTTQEKTNGGET